MRAMLMFAALAVVLANAAPAAAAPPDATAATAPATSPAEAAWVRYRDALTAQHEELLANPFAQDPLVRSEGLYFLQSIEASAFNMYVAPRQQYPALYKQSIYMPFELSWGTPSPDFLYRHGYIDGAHTYRIWGNRKGSEWATMQVFRGFWGDGIKDTQMLTNVDFDKVPTTADGGFEIFLGPNPPANPDGKFWVKLDPDRHNITLLLREVFYDWGRDVPMDLHIEALDRSPDARIYVGEDDLAARIDKARNFAVYNWQFTLAELKRQSAQPRNAFFVDQTAQSYGGNPLACYIGMLYDLKPDEALIIEAPVKEARYWSIQLGTIWSQTIDYSYHQSSLNNAQIKVDPDGHYRAVLSLKDPGVPNWLDPAGVPLGLATIRFYKSPYCVAPTVKKVRLDEVRQNLPADTPVVTPQQRQEALTARRLASLRRYGE